MGGALGAVLRQSQAEIEVLDPAICSSGSRSRSRSPRSSATRSSALRVAIVLACAGFALGARRTAAWTALLAVLLSVAGLIVAVA